jgi:hypothetical protein
MFDRAEYVKAYNIANKDRIKARAKVYREAHKDERKAYREANKDRIKAYREANKDRIKAQRKAYREETKNERSMSFKVYREANKSRLSARSTAYYASHKEEAKAWAKERRKAIKPEIVAEQHLHDSVAALGGMCPKFIDPSRRGAPDRMVLLPGMPVYFVEMKRAKLGKVAPHQERYHASLRALGHRVWVLWSNEDVDSFINEVTLT